MYEKQAVPYAIATLAVYRPGKFWCVCFWNLLFVSAAPGSPDVRMSGAAMQGHWGVRTCPCVCVFFVLFSDVACRVFRNVQRTETCFCACNTIHGIIDLQERKKNELFALFLGSVGGSEQYFICLAALSYYHDYMHAY